MDPNQSTNYVPPRKVPHLPISEAESHPEIYQDNPSSSKNTLLTLASLLVLAGIAGITLWLYIKNSSERTPNSTTGSPIKIKSEKRADNSNSALKSDIAASEDHSNIVITCKKFSSLEEALENKDLACGLDLSSNGLKEFPKDILKLTKLNDLNLSNNKLESLPKELFEMPLLMSINLSSNNIINLPTMTESKKTEYTKDKKILLNQALQVIDLRNNKVTESDKRKFEKIYKAAVKF